MRHAYVYFLLWVQIEEASKARGAFFDAHAHRRRRRWNRNTKTHEETNRSHCKSCRHCSMLKWCYGQKERQASEDCTHSPFVFDRHHAFKEKKKRWMWWIDVAPHMSAFPCYLQHSTARIPYASSQDATMIKNALSVDAEVRIKSRKNWCDSRAFLGALRKSSPSLVVMIFF